MELMHRARYPDMNTGKRKRSTTTRKKPAPRWVRPTAKAGGVLATIAIVIGGPTFLWQSGTISRGLDMVWESAISHTAKQGLRVDSVLLRGRQHESHSRIMRTVSINRGDPTLGVNLSSLRRRLIKLPWIRDAVVKRQWPGTIDIQISERKPLVLWQRKKRLYLVDTTGTVIRTKSLSRFHHLLTVVGNGAPKAAPTLLAMIAGEPSLADKVTAATLVGKRRWNLQLKGGINVRLPEKDPHNAWRRLARLHAKHKLLARDIRMIDMRLPNRLLIRPGVLGTQTTRVKGQRT
tara:strand:- start:25030 stop:25902 length:873 start_codon:yes stop_codon:yes gene_type:complete